MRLGYLPTDWLNSRGIFIPKPGKAEYNHPKSYRMITLTSIQLKLLERLIYWFLLWNTEVERNMHKAQYGFRTRLSTEVALHRLVHNLEKAIHGGT